MTRTRYALTVNVAAWPPDFARLWREAHFVTDERHTAIDIRLQCFAAAVLAVAGDEAFRHAAIQADRHEARGGLPVARYNRAMIRNPQAYARQSEDEDRAALRAMTAEESIAIGEALLTSDLMRLAQFPDDDHPRSLAIALGLRSTAAAYASSLSRPLDRDSETSGRG